MDRSSEFDRRKSPLGFVRTTPPFVGRHQHLEWLERCLQEAIAGRPWVGLISGEAGIGKTRLHRELQTIAGQRGMRVCYGRGYEDLTLPYLPFVDPLLTHLGQVPKEVEPSLAAEAEVISQILDRDRYRTPLASPPISGQADQEKLRLLVAVARTTIALAQSCPTLLIIDDLHWADPPSLDLLGHLVFSIADTAVREPVPILILGTYRPEELQSHLVRLIARLQREDICQTFSLTGLHESEIYELIQGMGLLRPSHQLVETISQVTQGNPLFIQEVVHHLLHQGALQERGGYIVTTSAATDLRLPEQVTGAILARSQRLSEDCRRGLTLAAFLGENFSLQALCAVSGMNEDELLSLLEEGMEQRFLLSEGQAFQFAHPLIRHVFYSEPSAARRQRLHEQIAQTLERLYVDSLDAHLLEIAHHLIRAGPAAKTEKVATYARRAGHQALNVSAWSEAARYYEAALSTASPIEFFSPHDRAELHYLAGIAHYRDMDVGPCLDQYEKAIDIYRSIGDTQGLAQVLMEKMRIQTTLASVPYGTLADVQPLEEILKTLGENAAELRGNILARMAQTYWHARQPEKAETMARRAMQIGQDIQNDHLYAHASHGLALAQIQSLHVKEALESWQNARVYARHTDDLWLQGLPLTRLPMTLGWLGRLDEAEAAAQEAWEVIRKTHDWGNYSLALAALVLVAVVRGDFEAAERYTQETMTMMSRSRYPWGGVIALPALASAYALRGLWDKAEETIDTLLEPGRVFEEPGPAFKADTQVFRQLLQVYSEAPAAKNEQHLTNPQKEEGHENFDIGSMAHFCARVELGDLMAVPSMVEHPYHVLSLAAERGVLFTSRWVFLIPRVLGVAATLNRWWDKAEIHFQRAIETATGIGSRPELGRSYLDYARMLIARDRMSDRSRAIDLLRQACLIFDELDMAPYSRRAARLTEMFQTPLPLAPHQDVANADNLSDRETEILLGLVLSRTRFLG